MGRKKPEVTPAIRDRIRELRRIPAKELLPNPRNWRRHPREQATALQGILAEVGYADALLARETPDGLMLIDGHLRAETTPDQLVPVLVLDVDDAEANKLLATLDPLAAMAETDKLALKDLAGLIQTDSAELRELLDGTAGIAREAAQDAIPALPVTPVARLGQIWQLGGASTAYFAATLLIFPPASVKGCQNAAAPNLDLVPYYGNRLCARGWVHSYYSSKCGNSSVSPNRTVYIGVIPVYCRYAVHSPETQALSSSPSDFHTFPKPKLIGILVELPWRQLTVHVESEDLIYHPRLSVYEISGLNFIRFCGVAEEFV
jgi:hypothetical protein